ncbi:MAG: PadR family transcriptional regulator [Actinobacteria bacterium]|nr:PadR family transcriptional regulator [Actinomycetota bacterium]
MDPAALYRTLRALEEEGSVRSRWAGAERGAPRRVYALTDAGEGRLRQSLAAVADQRDTLARRPGSGPPSHATASSQHVARRPCCPPPPVGLRPVRRSRSHVARSVPALPPRQPRDVAVPLRRLRVGVRCLP